MRGALLSKAEVTLHKPITSQTVRYLIAGGGAPEMELAIKLSEYAKSLLGMESQCVSYHSELMAI